MTTRHGRTLVEASPGAADGVPPVPYLDIGSHLGDSTNVDRLAVGLALIYSPWLSGPMQAPQDVSVLTAQRISEFFGERFVTVSSVTDAPQQLPRGLDEVHIFDLAMHQLQPGSEASASLRLAPYTTHEGTVSFGRHATVASNVHLFASPGSSGWGAGLNVLGLAVILAEGMDASILIHASTAGGADPLHALLECVGLGLAPS